MLIYHSYNYFLQFFVFRCVCLPPTQELAAKQAEIEKLQSDLRIAKFSIQQMEEENNSLIHRSV